MKILLINPSNKKVLQGNNPSWLDDSRGCNPPLGLMYIASSLLATTRHYVDLWDCQVLGDADDKLRFGGYDVVGITATTFTLLDVVDTINKVKSLSPKTKIVVGGTHPTIYPDETIALGADAVIKGEGETIFPNVINSVFGLKGSIHSMHKPIKDLDSISFPYRTNIHSYHSIFSKGIATTIFSSRGCPYNCAFCYRPVMGRICRHRSAKNVVDEIEHCVNRSIRDFLFYDDTFTVNKHRTFQICDEIKKRKLKIKFDVRSRVDTVDCEILHKLKQAGMYQIHYGIEAGTQKVLNRLNKSITLEQIRKAFKITKRLGIRTLGYIMIGCPDETVADIEETRKFVKKLKPDYLHATIFTPFPATPLYEEWVERKGIDVWKTFATFPREGFRPPVWDDIPRDKLSKILITIYKGFYLRSSYAIKRLFEVDSANRFRKYARAGLNMWRAR